MYYVIYTPGDDPTLGDSERQFTSATEARQFADQIREKNGSANVYDENGDEI